MAESVRAHAQGGVEMRGPVAAWVDYFRDLGIYDFYRWSEAPAELRAEEPAAEVAEVSVAAADVGPVVAAEMVAAPRVDVGFVETSVAQEAGFGAGVLAASGLVPLDRIAPAPEVVIPAGERGAALAAIQAGIGDCTRCPLAYGGRRKIVFGDGSPTARLMFVGEGPGADEDEQGLPFVGKAGQLLNNMITAIGLKREEVYIANIVKCRPPANRVPEPVEANTCSPFLLAQIDVVRPEVIVALGSTAATYLLGVKQALAGLRGRWHRVRDAKVAVTYHPAFLLRDPRMKAEAWKDLQMVMGEMGLKPPQKKG